MASIQAGWHLIEDGGVPEFGTSIVGVTARGVALEIYVDADGFWREALSDDLIEETIVRWHYVAPFEGCAS